MEKPSAAATSAVTACLECDLLMRRPPHSKATEVRCPRCGSRDPSSRHYSPQTSMATALAALILAIPANLYPQMEFALLAHPNGYTLAGGALALIEKGFWWVGSLILICTVIAPIVLLLCICLASLLWSSPRYRQLNSWLLRLHYHINSWVMLDVYLLAVIVSVVKLKDMGQFELTIGFFCFVGMLLLTTAANLLFNREACWNALENQSRARH